MNNFKVIDISSICKTFHKAKSTKQKWAIRCMLEYMATVTVT